MKKLITVLLFVLINLGINAQWQQTNGPYGALVRNVAASGNNVFALTDYSMFLSTNSGANWSIPGMGSYNSSFNCIKFSGADVYAGSYYGELFHTSDYGINWTQIAAFPVFGANPVTDIIINGSDMYASINGAGVYSSSNSGASWVSSNSGLSDSMVNALAINGSNLFAGTEYSGMFLSANNGASWTSINNGLGGMSIKSISTSGSNIFAGTDVGVYLSTNNGSSWTAANNGLGGIVSKIEISGSNIFAMDNGAIYRSVNNGASWFSVNNSGFISNTLYSFTVDGSILYAGTRNGVYVSPDYGSTWNSSNAGLFARDNSLVSNTNTIFSNTGSGLFSSSDNGTNWSYIYTIGNNLQINSISTIGNSIYAGVNNGLYMSQNNGISWTDISSGQLIGSVEPIGNIGTTLFILNNGELLSSPDNGANWLPIYIDTSFFPIQTILIKGNKIFAANMVEGVCLSTDMGITWTPINNGLITLDPTLLSAIGDNIIVEESSGVYITANDGANWTPFNTGLPQGSYISSMTPVGNNLFFTNNSSIYVSPDIGTNWTNVSNGYTDTISGINLYANGGFMFAGTAFSGVWKRPLSEMVSCLANFTTSYDSVANLFTLTVDPTTTAMAIGYHWDFGDGTTSTLAAPSHTYTVDSLYTVCLKIYTSTGDSCEFCHVIGIDAMGNVQRTNGFLLQVVNPGVATSVSSNIIDETKISVDPNPSSGMFQITSNNSSIKKIEVFNLIGEVIYHSFINSKQSTLDLSGFDKGIYFVQVETEKGRVNRKIVVE